MDFLSTLLAATVTVGLGAALSHGALRGAVRGALGIMLVLTITIPFVGMVNDLTEFDFSLPDYSDGATDGFAEVTLTAFEEGVAVALSDRYGEVLSGTRVSARGFLASDMLADGITVVLPRGSEWLDYREIREYIEKSFTRGGVCEVIYG